MHEDCGGRQHGFGGRHLAFTAHHGDFRGRNDTFGERHVLYFLRTAWRVWMAVDVLEGGK